EQREALILVGAGGFSYEDAAAICHCAVGTVKSRVARARKSLLSLLEGDEALPPTAQSGDASDAAEEILAQLDRLAPDAPNAPHYKRNGNTD
ncbi:MAG TPA: sigma factor-like helix-turn-helix DNA-binding protein, partial [Rhizomicrobium sp.]|nr:sigma factor-like helix-turn-helix DNA-binding protein [Rhizomicrobium sp.]